MGSVGFEEHRRLFLAKLHATIQFCLAGIRLVVRRARFLLFTARFCATVRLLGSYDVRIHVGSGYQYQRNNWDDNAHELSPSLNVRLLGPSSSLSVLQSDRPQHATICCAPASSSS